MYKCIYNNKSRSTATRPTVSEPPSGSCRGAMASIIAITAAEERQVQVSAGISVWLRTWGNAASGIPVLFVHGGC